MMEWSQIETIKEAGVKLQKALNAIFTISSSFSKQWLQCSKGRHKGFWFSWCSCPMQCICFLSFLIYKMGLEMFILCLLYLWPADLNDSRGLPPSLVFSTGIKWRPTNYWHYHVFRKDPLSSGHMFLRANCCVPCEILKHSAHLPSWSSESRRCKFFPFECHLLRIPNISRNHFPT